jgi:hypothetical protein
MADHDADDRADARRTDAPHTDDAGTDGRMGEAAAHRPLDDTTAQRRLDDGADEDRFDDDAPDLVEPPAAPTPASQHVNAATTGVPPLEEEATSPAPPVVPVADDRPVEGATSVVDHPVAPAPAEPIAPTADLSAAPIAAAAPAAAAPSAAASEQQAPQQPRHQIVYITAPVPPKKRGNRWFGVVIGLAATALFLVIYGLVGLGVLFLQRGAAELRFLYSADLAVPVLFFLAGVLVIALILNRAGWWAWILTSLLLGLFVYAGTILVYLLVANVTVLDGPAAAELLGDALINPLFITAGVVAREVALWAGALIGFRGRRTKTRNADARDRFEREQAEQRAAYERQDITAVTV